MSKAHFIQPSGPSADSQAVRLGAGATTGDNLTYKELWKLVKLSATDTYDLCAAGDAFDGAITSVEVATSAGWTIGGVNTKDMMYVIADGLQATAGTGTIAAGDYVVCGTVVAKDTALAATTYAKVCKATNQPGATVVSTLAGADTAAAVKTVLDAALVKVADAEKNTLKAWRVASLGTVGTGAVGTIIVIERIGGGK